MAERTLCILDIGKGKVSRFIIGILPEMWKNGGVLQKETE